MATTIAFGSLEALHNTIMSSPAEPIIATTTNTLPTLPPHNDDPTPQTSRLPFIITSLYLGTFLVALDTIILNPALPAITKTFDALDHLAWYGSVYLLALTALQPVLGKVYKIGNVKGLYLGCVGVFEGMCEVRLMGAIPQGVSLLDVWRRLLMVR